MSNGVESGTNWLAGVPDLFRYAQSSVLVNIHYAFGVHNDKDQLVNKFNEFTEETMTLIEEQGILVSCTTIPVDYALKIKFRYTGDMPLTAHIRSMTGHQVDWGKVCNTVILTQDDSVITDDEWKYCLRPSWCFKRKIKYSDKTN